MVRKKLLAFALQQQIPRAGFDKHAETSLTFDKLLVDQFLISLQNRERIDPIFGRDIAHRRQRIAFVEYAVENHGDDTIPKLAINRLTIVPFTLHPVFHHPSSFSDIVNYSTVARASLFLFFFGRRSRRYPLPVTDRKASGLAQKKFERATPNTNFELRERCWRWTFPFLLVLLLTERINKC